MERSRYQMCRLPDLYSTDIKNNSVTEPGQGMGFIARLVRKHVLSHPLAVRRALSRDEVEEGGRLFPCKVPSGAIGLIVKRFNVAVPCGYQ